MTPTLESQIKEKICRNCSEPCGKIEISIECSECNGDGFIEEQDSMTGQFFTLSCDNCNRTGYINVHDYFCDDDCYLEFMQGEYD